MQNPIRGKTIRWKFRDGPMKGHEFEHHFGKDGTVTWRMLGGDAGGKMSQETKCEIAQAGAEVYAVSYLGDSGYTLTVVLDFASGTLVAFASNEKSLTVQHGTFEHTEATHKKSGGVEGHAR